MESKNMNYLYNVEYYDGLKDSEDKFTVIGDSMAKRTSDIVSFPFQTDEALLTEFDQIDGVQYFDLYTAYPGLMIGTGALHEISMEDTLKNGFTFDYVTGLPYLPGSSLKGSLRSYFPQKGKDEQAGKEAYIKSCLDGKDIDIYDFVKWAFGDEGTPGKGIFIGAFPVLKNSKKLLSLEYITPHTDKFTNPIPISMLKIKPNTLFRFLFSFSDYKEDEKVILSAADIMKLFKQIILDMGIGAKTNVGFGVMVEKETQKNITVNNITSSGNGASGQMHGNNRLDSSTGSVKKCTVCKRNYQTMYKGKLVDGCPFCAKKNPKKK